MAAARRPSGDCRPFVSQRTLYKKGVAVLGNDMHKKTKARRVISFEGGALNRIAA